MNNVHPIFKPILDGIFNKDLGLWEIWTENSVFYRCRCGHEYHGNKNTDINWLVCPVCERRGCWEELPF